MQREFGMPLDLHTPPFVIGQMKVEHIHLVEGQQVDVTPEILRGQKSSGAVKHQAAPAEPRLVLDPHCRDRPCSARDRLAALDFRRQQLTDRLDSVEKAGWSPGSQCDPLRPHFEFISFGPERFLSV